MSAAQGPRCVGGCGKRVSKYRVTSCPWCGRVLCLNCKCPEKCWEIAERLAHSTPVEVKR